MTRILVIDDSEAMRRTIRRMLESGGYAVVEAGNGSEGLSHLESGGIDLAITDLLMPETDGLEFLKKAATLAPGLPVIAMSGGARELPAAVGLSISAAFGALRTLYKPFKKAELLSSVDVVLAGRKLS